MYESYRVFEIDDNGTLKVARTQYDSLDLVFNNREEAEEMLKHSLKGKECVVLKTITVEPDIVEDFDLDMDL